MSEEALGTVADVSADTSAEVSAETEQYQSDMDILNSEDAPPAVTDDSSTDTPATTTESTDETPAAEEEQPEDESTEEKPAEDAKAAEDEKAAILEPGDKAVQELREKLNADPDKKAVFDKDPAFRNQMFRNARLATEAAAYKEHFPTLAVAEMARIAAEDFADVEAKYFGSKDPKVASELRKQMWEGDLVRDQNGEPIKNADGTFQVHGRYDHFFHDYRKNDFYPQLLAVAAQHGREAEIGEALAVIQEFLGEEPVTAVAPKTAEARTTDNSRLTPTEREALAKLDRLEREQAQAKQGETETYRKSVGEATHSSVNDFLLKRVQRMAPAMSAGIQQKVVSDAFRKLNDIAAKDSLFQLHKERLLKIGGEEGKKRYVAEMGKFTEARYSTILQDLIKEYAQPVVAASAEKRVKLDTQKTQAAVKGGAGVPSPSQQDEAELIAEGDKLSKQIHGRKLNTLEVMSLEEVLPKLRAKAQLLARRA